MSAKPRLYALCFYKQKDSHDWARRPNCELEPSHTWA